ncbi:glycoside hydrolase family 88 protein [Lacticaseibacillus parahuelsenbergensis]|uniref:Glycoside hydrolase family 88 protein n=1 Tax=Lacticaseibacillus parahuelsenbergensis TaxID=3068305 RepID=A0ABY9L255_9LACO|nr:glycoside hydrolase family 88 protein [Lacticaseibacillus sp. NCIMB 15471]WLV77796.1 glycoside hydrolase family 88 protein [Lacticaseibacillus sp. NCIMB 15471]
MKIENLTNAQRFFNAGIVDRRMVTTALDNVVAHLDLNIKVFGENFPEPSTVNNRYAPMKNTEWTNGFWTGMLWLAYEYTGEQKYRALAEKNVASFADRIDRKISVDHHDLGFLYSPSVVSAYRLTNSQLAKDTGIKAADQLLTRFHEKGGFIQAWGAKGAKDENRLIIDALLNIPLLYWATSVTGDAKYRQVADQHYQTALKTVFRPDGSTFHTYFFDDAGKPLRGATKQGYADDSDWARGQAWAIYGTALHYYDTHDAAAFDSFKAVTNFFLNRLPQDDVPYWDLIFQEGSDQSRDSSSAAIAVCGLHEMLKYLPEADPDKPVYRAAMHAQLKSLIQHYATPVDGQTAEPLLVHGVYSWHSGHGVDEGNLWGDYFYMEALIRFYKDWQLYW